MKITHVELQKDEGEEAQVKSRTSSYCSLSNGSARKLARQAPP